MAQQNIDAFVPVIHSNGAQIATKIAVSISIDTANDTPEISHSSISTATDNIIPVDNHSDTSTDIAHDIPEPSEQILSQTSTKSNVKTRDTVIRNQPDSDSEWSDVDDLDVGYGNNDNEDILSVNTLDLLKRKEEGL